MKYLLIIVALTLTLFANETNVKYDEKEFDSKKNMSKNFEKSIFSEFQNIPRLKDINKRDLNLEISGEIVIIHSF